MREEKGAWKGARGDAGGCMREGGGAVAPVKIDPPHSFPTFSPREVCYHESEDGVRKRKRTWKRERRG